MIRSRTYGWLVTICVASLACSISGLSLPASNGPLNSDSLSTIVAGTAEAASAQTAQAPSAMATPSGASTETAGPPSTATATATPPVVFSPYGTALSPQPDGSTLFIDKQLGYQIVIPPGLTPFRINESEFYKLWMLPASQEPLVKGNLTSIQSMDPHIFRLFAFDLRDGHFQSNALTNTDVSWSQTVNSYSQNVNGLQNQYSKSYSYVSLLSSKTKKNSSQLEVNVAEFKYVYQGTEFYEKMTVFKVKAGGILMIRTDTAYTLKSLNMPDIDQLQGSVNLISE